MHLHQKGTPGYILNMDPAVSNVPYEPNIDIRDTVGHKLSLQICIELCARSHRCFQVHAGLSSHDFVQEHCIWYQLVADKHRA